MTLVSDRNIQLNEAATGDRAIQFLIKMKEVLLTAGWSLIGNGDGTSNVNVNLAGGATDYFPTFPAITGMAAGAWFAVESSSGAQLVFQHLSSSDVHMYWSATGVYTDDSPTHSLRLGGTTPPADEITQPQSYVGFGTNAGQKFSVVYDDTATSFVVFGAYTGNDVLGGFFLELTGTKTGDTAPYVGWWYFRPSYDVWDQLNIPTADLISGWHPDGNQREYSFGKVRFDGVTLMDNLPADPVSADEQLMDCLIGCQEPTAYQIRGTAPIIKWMSGLRGTGDSFAGNRYMGIGECAIDGWSSVDPFES